MCENDIGVVRNLVPVTFAFRPSPGVESPVVEPRCPWAAPYFVAEKVNGGVFEIDAGFCHRLLQFDWIFDVFELPEPHDQIISMYFPFFKVERHIVITSYDYFMLVWERIELPHEFLYLFWSPDVREISGVYQNIAFRHIFERFVITVGVGEADESDVAGLFGLVYHVFNLSNFRIFPYFISFLVQIFLGISVDLHGFS